MKKFLLMLILISTPSMAYEYRPPPPDMTVQHVTFQIHCVATFNRMIDVLTEYYGEKPLVMSELGPELVLTFFINKDLTTSSLVVTRYDENAPGDLESCIIWKGNSPEGKAFMIPPEVEFPTEFKGIENQGEEA